MPVGFSGHFYWRIEHKTNIIQHISNLSRSSAMPLIHQWMQPLIPTLWVVLCMSVKFDLSSWGYWYRFWLMVFIMTWLTFSLPLQCVNAGMDTLTLARFICELSLLDMQFVPVRASLLASACLLIALVTKDLGGWVRVRLRNAYTIREFINLTVCLWNTHPWWYRHKLSLWIQQFLCAVVLW